MALGAALTLPLGILLGVAGLPSAAADPARIVPVEKVADAPSIDDFPGSGDATSYTNISRTPGRIWTDKSVFTDGVPSRSEAGIDGLLTDDNELAVTLSALGSTRQIDAEIQIPIDLVLVLDNSYSMTQCVVESAAADGYCNDPGNYQGSRAYAMMEAINAALRVIEADSPDNRVALVQFGNGASVLQPLGQPQKIAGQDVYASLAGPAYNDGSMTLRTATGTLVIGGGTQLQAQSTNIQQGIYTGMNLLANQAPAGVTGAAQRLPNVLVFSDGEPTLSATANDWWAIPNNSATQGPAVPGNTQYYGNGFKAALTAAFLKNKIDSVYNDPAYNTANGLQPVKTRVYTVGLGLASLTENGGNLARTTLDPLSQVGQAANSMAQGFTTAFNSYLTGGTPAVPVAQYGTYTVRHPGGANAAFEVTNIKYNDAFFAPITTDELVETFQSIAKQIVDAAPKLPIHVDETSGQSLGYVTFTDTLGNFMQVTDVNRITFCSVLPGDNPGVCTPQTFLNPTQTQVSATERQYTFHGTYSANDFVENADLTTIIVTVRTSHSLAVGDRVSVQIPDALMPLKSWWITEDQDGNPVAMKQSFAHPTHLSYKVAPKTGVLENLANPMALNSATSQDGTALAEYIQAHTIDGLVRFYSNDYNVTQTAAGPEISAATLATFVPAKDNDFYRVATNKTLYTDPAGLRPITAEGWERLAGDTAVYYLNDEYHYLAGSQTAGIKVQAPVATTKQTLLDSEETGLKLILIDGLMTAPAGFPNVTIPRSLDHVKCEQLDWATGLPVCVAGVATANASGTAAMARSSQLIDETVQVALGNNGYLAYQVPGTLDIRKSVQAANGLNPDPDQEFTFRVDLRGADQQVLPGQFRYSVYTSSNSTTPVATDSIRAGETLTLRAGQRATITGLPDQTAYTVTEVALPAGYTPVRPAGGSAAGVIDVNTANTAAIEIENSYQPSAAVITAQPVVVKELQGRDWAAGDTFTAELCPVTQDLPCLSADFSQGLANTGTASFGAQSFTEPGNYAFTITERDDLALPGITYSNAIYRWLVTVTDDGRGALQASGQLFQVNGDNGVMLPEEMTVDEARFINVFDAASLSVQLTAWKAVQDLSTAAGLAGDTRSPNREYSFTFSYEGVDLEQSGVVGSLPAPPQFDGDADQDGQVTVKNVGAQVKSPNLTYQREHVGHTFYFKAVEVADPAQSHVVFSDAAWFWKAVVGYDGSAIYRQLTYCVSSQSDISTAAPLGDCDPVNGDWQPARDGDRQFVNVYQPDPVVAALTASKTFQGRPWLDDDRFTFELTANDLATQDAVTAGAIELPASNRLTVGGDAASNGRAEFSFGDITFHQQGEYQFAIQEVTPVDNKLPGVSYDSRSVIYEVSVTDPGSTGGLRVAVRVRGDDTSFTNQYQATRVFGSLEISKKLTGRSLALGEFSFTITPADEASRLKAGLSAGYLQITNGDRWSDPTGTLLPGEFNFNQTDLGKKYSYRITEDAGSLGGVTYDATEYQVTLEALYDQASGELYVLSQIDDGQAVTYHDSRTSSGLNITFNNSYQAADAQATPLFTKELIGRDWGSQDEYSFRIAPLTADAPLPASTEVTITSAAAAAGFGFGPIGFTTAGVYQYEVTELVPARPLPGIIYDPDTALVTISVTDNHAGQLVAQVAYDGNEVFTNYYEAEFELTLEVAKTLTGREMVAGEFRFQSQPADEAAARAADMTLDGITWTNHFGHADGVTEVMPWSFVISQDLVRPEPYCYSLSEVVPAAPAEGISYDRTRYEFCLTVSGDGQGGLTVDTTVQAPGYSAGYSNSSGSAPQVWPRFNFHNEYSAPVQPDPTPTPEPSPSDPTTPEPSDPATPEPTPTPSPSDPATPEPTPTPSPSDPATPEPSDPASPTPSPSDPASPEVPTHLTLIAVVDNGNSSNTYTGADVWLTAGQGDELIDGNGTGQSQLGGTEKVIVIPGDYELSNSTLEGYHTSQWTCRGLDAAGAELEVVVSAGNQVRLPLGSDVTCVITYDIVLAPTPEPSPSDPGEPTPEPSPSDPGEPTPEPSPSDPGEPTPGEPGDPGDPGDPTPGDPGDPADPSVPGDPDSTPDPDEPGQGEPTPSVPAPPSQLPTTGANPGPWPVLGGIALLTGIALLVGRRRVNRD